MTKDRIEELRAKSAGSFHNNEGQVKQENEKKESQEPRNGSKKKGKEYIKLKGPVTEAFLEKIRMQQGELNEEIEKLRAMKDAIRSLQDGSFLSTSDSSRQQIEDKLDEFRQESRRVKVKILQWEHLATTKTPKSPSQRKMIETQVKTLLRQFSAILDAFRVDEMHYKDKIKEAFLRHKNIAQLDLTEEQVDDMLENNAAVFTEDVLQENAKARQALEDAQQRHKDIIKLEKSIEEIAEMMKDIALLIQDQGETVDNIERNMMTAEEHISSAGDELVKARASQSRHRRCKIGCGVTIAIIIGVTVVIILLTQTDLLKK